MRMIAALLALVCLTPFAVSLQPGGAQPGEGTVTNPDDPPPPPTFEGAVDSAAAGLQATGEFTFGASASWGPTAGFLCPASDDSTVGAIGVLKFVHAHRLPEEPTDQDVMDLVMADAVVSGQFFSLSSGGPLTTDAGDDLRATLNHATLVENYGTGGPVTASGTVLTSQAVGGPWCAPPDCLNDLGGLISWPYGRAWVCMPSGCERFQEAVVYLTVVRPNGSLYRAVTMSVRCGCHTGITNGSETTSGYAFKGVPTGQATVLARPVLRCCQSGTGSRAVSCPPGPRSYRPCVPIAPTAVLDFSMGPWTPPVVYGHVSNPGNTLTHVSLATYESSCQETSWDDVLPQELPFPINYSIASCLPSNPWIYASATGPDGHPWWAEAPGPPPNLPCGVGYRADLSLSPAPCIEGNITNWRSCMAGHYVVTFNGCFMSSCNAGGTRTVEAFVDNQGHYTSGYSLRPAQWLIQLWYIPNPSNPSYRLPAGTSEQYRLPAAERCHVKNFTSVYGC